MLRKIYPLLLSLLLISILYTSIPLSSTSYSPSAVLDDRTSSGLFLDLDKIRFTSNGTHVTINASWYGDMPRSRDTRSYYLHRQLFIYFDN
ncbi:MAG: hypothetical protein J7K21_03690 [Desulfurococcales archaeon]|nr:hypothetical protein [Desulfurococcales archaeon]